MAETETARMDRIQDLNALERHSEALALANQGIESQPGLIEYYFSKSGALSSLGMKAESDAVLDGLPEVIFDLLAENPEDPSLLASAGYLLAKEEKLQEATEAFEKSIAINSKSARSYLYWGRALKMKGFESFGEAVEKYQAGLLVDPDHRRLRIQLYADLEFMAPRSQDESETLYEEALRQAREAIRRHGTSAMVVQFFSRGAFLKRRDPELAVSLLTDFREENPKAAELEWFQESVRLLKQEGIPIPDGLEINPTSTSAPAPSLIPSTVRPWLGFVPDYLERDVEGAKIHEVPKGGPAEEAGLMAGDVVVSLGGNKVETILDLSAAIETLTIGREAEISVLRNGQTQTLKITPEGRK